MNYTTCTSQELKIIVPVNDINQISNLCGAHLKNMDYYITRYYITRPAFNNHLEDRKIDTDYSNFRDYEGWCVTLYSTPKKRYIKQTILDFAMNLAEVIMVELHLETINVVDYQLTYELTNPVLKPQLEK